MADESKLMGGIPMQMRAGLVPDAPMTKDIPGLGAVTVLLWCEGELKPWDVDKLLRAQCDALLEMAVALGAGTKGAPRG